MNYRKHWLLAVVAMGVSVPALTQELQKDIPIPVKDDLLDSLLSISIILFILSVITEKITQLIRKYSPFIKKGDKLHGGYLSTVWQNIRKKQPSGTTEMGDKIEREVNSLSFIVGLFISAIFCVDLFMMMKTANPNETLYWTSEKWNYYTAGKGHWAYRFPLLIVSMCLTGFFLTFGSKFFHDLIDTLFQVKNLKRKLSDDRTFKDPQSIEELEDFIKTPELKLAQLAVDQQSASIKSIEGVLTVGYGYMNINGQKVGCIEVHVNNDTTAQAIQSKYPITMASGLKVDVPVNIIITGKYPVAAVGAGGGIANKTKFFGAGTLGGIVKDKVTGNKYILSCHHVLNGDMNWKGLSKTKDVIDPATGTVLGKLAFGFRSGEFDTALAKIPANSTLSNAAIGNPSSIRAVVPLDAIKETEVSVLGAKTGKTMTGIVYNDSWSTKFEYPDGLWGLRDLIVLTKMDGNRQTTLTQGGDSGSLVIDKNNIVIGMIVGGDEKFSYAIKMNKIELEFDIQLA